MFCWYIHIFYMKYIQIYKFLLQTNAINIFVHLASTHLQQKTNKQNPQNLNRLAWKHEFSGHLPTLQLSVSVQYKMKKKLHFNRMPPRRTTNLHTVKRDLMRDDQMCSAFLYFSESSRATHTHTHNMRQIQPTALPSTHKCDPAHRQTQVRPSQSAVIQKHRYSCCCCLFCK